MTTIPTSPRQTQSFALGQILCTQGVLQAATEHPDLMAACIARHARSDWGCVCPEDAETNDEAVRDGFRILSAYPIDPALPCKGYGENCVWVITEADRSVTTLLLPDEY